MAKIWCQCFEDLGKMFVNGESGCWFTGRNPALSVTAWNQVGMLWTCTGSRGATEWGYAKRPGQKAASLWGLVPPGTVGDTEAGLGCSQADQGRMLELSDTAEQEHRCARASSLSSWVWVPNRTTADTCSVVEGLRKTRGHSSGNNRLSCISYRKSHFPDDIRQPIGGKL